MNGECRFVTGNDGLNCGNVSVSKIRKPLMKTSLFRITAVLSNRWYGLKAWRLYGDLNSVPPPKAEKKSNSSGGGMIKPFIHILLLLIIVSLCRIKVLSEEVQIKFGHTVTIDDGKNFFLREMFSWEKDRLVLLEEMDDLTEFHIKRVVDKWNLKKYLLDFTPDLKTLAVLNAETKELSIVSRKGKNEYQMVGSRLILPASAYDIKLDERTGKVFIAGFRKDGEMKNAKSYELFAIDPQNRKMDFLLPVNEKYGVAVDQYIMENKKGEYGAVGLRSFIELNGDYCYLAWEGNFQIVALNLKTLKIKRFGQPSAQYRKPGGETLLRLYKGKKYQALLEERKVFSYVRGLFSTAEELYVLIEMAGSKGRQREFLIQQYTLDGQFTGEENISSRTKKKITKYISFDKKNSTLYCAADNSRPLDIYYFVVSGGYSDDKKSVERGGSAVKGSQGGIKNPKVSSDSGREGGSSK